MASKKEYFDLSGPLHLTSVDWDDAKNRMTVAASLVQGVYILERDRQERREGPNALAPPWWDFFNFKLLRPLVEDADSSIFGAIYEFKPQSSQSNDILHRRIPHYVIAFRGTMIKTDTFRDIKSDIQESLHQDPRAEIAVQAVRNVVASANDSNIWLSGHSLGSAMSMLCGKTMAKNGKFLESFLFNPPYVGPPIEIIKYKMLKHGIRFVDSVLTAGLAKVKQQMNFTNDQFAALSPWVPCLFVNPSDHICSEYIGYFEHRRRMQEIGAGGIDRLASQNSLTGLLKSAVGRELSEPLHLIPSANLTVNKTPSRFGQKNEKTPLRWYIQTKKEKEAHGIHQWWKPDLHLESTLHKY